VFVENVLRGFAGTLKDAGHAVISDVLLQRGKLEARSMSRYHGDLERS
jgi:hypothetical protein